MKRFISLFLPLLLLLSAKWSFSDDKPILRSGDRVAFLGNTIVERSRHFGQIETALQLGVGPEVTGLTFRNIGWSGDSVFGDARSYFGKPEEGRERLSTVLELIKPQVILICYGAGAAMSVDQGWTNESDFKNESASGLEKSLSTFIGGYEKMLTRVNESSGKGLREIVLISPPPLENLGLPLPDQTGNNKNIARFRDAIRKLAREKNHRFIDLFAAMGGDEFSGEITNKPLTNNGVHFGDAGYRVIARELTKGLGYSNLDQVGNDDEITARFRSLVVSKNTLFFNRWRPTNETYLFLFRKHEQGNNAKEIPMFDPFIEAKEKEIADLRKIILKGAVKQ